MWGAPGIVNGSFAGRGSDGVYHRRMTKKTPRSGGKTPAGKESASAGKASTRTPGKPAKPKKALPPWMPEQPASPGRRAGGPPQRGGGRTSPPRTGGRFVDPHAQREAQRYEQPIASREAILGFLEAAEG